MTIELLKDFTLPELIDTDNHDWERIAATFMASPRVFESALFKLHFKRKKPFTAQQKKNILRFLETGYTASRDVRYFNEFLWFYNDEDNAAELKEKLMQAFNKNVDSSGHHSFPLATKDEVRSFLDRNKFSSEAKVNNNLKVGLVGFPAFFGSIQKELKKAGFDVHQIFIPFHPNKKINKLLSIPLLVKGICWLKKNTFRYDTLNYHYKDPAIGAALLSRKFDIGFHKLNFIIKNNIFDNFRKGLINDHWAVLPHVRGKSTIAWTLLFGFPMVSTLHLIDNGVDTGKIIGFYEYDVKGIDTINGVRNKLRSTLTERIVDGVKRLSADEFHFIENTPSGGLTFYEIHPWLYGFVEERLKVKA